MDVRRPLIFVCSAAVLTLTAWSAVSLVPLGPGAPRASLVSALQPQPSLGVDPCVTAQVGDSFTVDIHAQNLTDLLAWEVYFLYDKHVVEVVGRDVRIFLASYRGSSVVDFSDPLPNSTGLYRAAAADLGGRDAMETGTGVLFTLTLLAKDVGISPASISPFDYDEDGDTDFGPTLSSSGGRHISDVDGDDIFDGAITSGQIAVDVACDGSTTLPPIKDLIDEPPTVDPPINIDDPPTPTPTPTPSNGGSPAGTSTPAPTSGPDQPQLTGSPTTETPSPGDTATPAPPSGDGHPQDGGSDSKIPSWIILIVAGTAILGFGLSILIIRSARRTA